jgi:hypothetical protein
METQKEGKIVGIMKMFFKEEKRMKNNSLKVYIFFRCISKLQLLYSLNLNNVIVWAISFNIDHH